MHGVSVRIKWDSVCESNLNGEEAQQLALVTEYIIESVQDPLPDI